ncbi:MAG: protease modulator HflC [Oscillospiraceae bacterium]|nr:protease modulator HflC [Oscillospiraceae bacterium]MDD4368408.1 protease modulator HflC [Oscillospiraceae bacterium]
MKKWLKRTALSVLLLALILLGFTSAYIVREGEYAYITQFGAIVRTVEQPGLNFKLPFVQEVNRLTSKVMVYDINYSEVLTADKKAMVVDSYALWRISNPTTFIRTVGSLSEMQKRIDASVFSVIKNVTGNLQQDAIVADEESQRASLNQQITDIVAQSLQAYGVEIPAVEIRRFDLPDDNLTAVYNRMISERSQMAASYEAEGEYEASIIRNSTDKEVEVLLGEARAEASRLEGEGEEAYMKVLSSIYQDPQMADFYLYTKELETLSEGLKGEKTLILGPDSPLAELFNQTAEGED